MKRVGSPLSSLDLVVVGGAAAAFVSGFLPWWSIQFDLLPGPFTVDGWSAGFTAWGGVLLLTVGGTLVLLRRAGISWPSDVARLALVVGTSTVGLLLVVIRWLTLPKSSVVHFLWTRYGFYMALIAGVIELAAAIVELRTSGEPLPWSRPGDANALG